mmetsp:Transcript_3549/g.4885  ORF Transcript_3549/g.4885 Transcript_3549/m.4885 type:complete len:484 (+) Transcript_3549:202-1653(+)
MDLLSLRKLLQILFFFALTFNSSFATKIYVNGTLWKTINTPSIRLGHDFTITGDLVLADPLSACPLKKNDEFKGKVVWATTDSGTKPCFFADILEGAEDWGVKAIILENKGFGGGFGFVAYFFNYDIKHSSSKIEAVESGKLSGIESLLKDKSNVVTIELVSGSNKVTESEPAWTAYSIIMGLFALVVLVMGAWKLKTFIDYKGLQASVPQVTLALHIIGATWRILSMVDPPYTRGIYPYQVTTFFDVTLYPIVLTATLLIGFYWEEAMRAAKVHSIPKLERMSFPFKISVALLFTIAFLAVILRSLNILPNFVSAINLIIAIIFSTPITLFYSIASGRVLRQLYRSKSLGKRQRALYKMTLYLVGSAVCMWLYLFEIIVLAAGEFTVARYFVLRFALSGGINLMSLFQILAFQNPAGVGSSSTGGGTPTTSAKVTQSFRSGRSISPSQNNSSQEEELDVVEMPSVSGHDTATQATESGAEDV